MNDLPIEAKLQNLANKLRQMWGQNPDADLIEEAAALLTPEAEAVEPQDPAPAPAKGKKTPKKEG